MEKLTYRLLNNINIKSNTSRIIKKMINTNNPFVEEKIKNNKKLITRDTIILVKDCLK